MPTLAPTPPARPGAALPSQTRRVPVSREHSRLAVMRAVPAEHRRPRHIMEWRRAAEAWAAPVGARADAVRHRLALVDALSQLHRPRTGTILTTWDALAARVGVCRRTIARHLRDLRAAGLLAVVATGRSAAHTPRGRQRNEAPVYAPIIPLDSRDCAPVERNVTPAPMGGLKAHPCARERRTVPESRRFAADLTHRQRAARAAFAHRARTRPDTAWSRHTTMGLDQAGVPRRALKAAICDLALTVQHFVLRARDATTAAVAAEIRPFALAGWSAGDIAHALTHSPDDARRWHSDAGFFRAETWMRHRLAAWLTAEGEVMRSLSQRAAAERADAVAARRADADRRAAERRRAAARRREPVGPGRAAVRALLEAARHDRNPAARFTAAPATR